MQRNSFWIKPFLIYLASLTALVSMSLGAFAAPGDAPASVSEQADRTAVYYVGTRYFKTRFGWTVAKLPLALTIQVDPVSSAIHEHLVGGMAGQFGSNSADGDHGGKKIFTPVEGSSTQFKIQFEGTEGSGLLQTSSSALITRSTTTKKFLDHIQWHWNFEVGDEHVHVEGLGQFEPGRLHIKGTIRNQAGKYLINYRDEYTEASFEEFSKMRESILSE